MMGIVSFIVVMIEANKAAQHQKEWIIAIDFSHILLFYLAIFFVIHAIYIMRLSYMAGKLHTRYQAEKVKSLIESIHETAEGCMSSFFYSFDLFPLSSTREKVEFKIMSIIFIDKFWLPENIDFSYYLTGCFEKFALKTIERGLFSWSVLVSLIIVNFIRVRANLFANCGYTNIFSHPAELHCNSTEATDDHHSVSPHAIDIYGAYGDISMIDPDQ